jgi:hypothetical protein
MDEHATGHRLPVSPPLSLAARSDAWRYMASSRATSCTGRA